MGSSDNADQTALVGWRMWSSSGSIPFSEATCSSGTEVSAWSYKTMLHCKIFRKASTEDKANEFLLGLGQAPGHHDSVV